MTSAQNKEFCDHISSGDELDLSIEWIKENLGPNDVFDQKTLEDWVQTYSTPGDTFTDDQLDDWAKENGYTKETE